MLSQIPFIYVNLLALCSFLLMFTAFAASKKTPVIRVFMVVLGDCILWSGSCVLMRLQMWPSMHFWYYVSLVTLFIMELLFYWFVTPSTARRASSPCCCAFWARRPSSRGR